MEKISTEGLVLHRSCLKCHHCHTSLRLGGYAFDRDDPEGHFYCTQHFKLPAKIIRPIPKKSMGKSMKQTRSNNVATEIDSANNINKIDNNNMNAMNNIITDKSIKDIRRPDAIAHLDLLDRGNTILLQIIK